MATRRSSLPASLSRLVSPTGLLRFVALLVLIVQLGVIAHRIEHYIAPEHMECGEDACDAFSPVPDAAAPILFVPPMLFIVFFVQFWMPRAVVLRTAPGRLGFQAHAPPL
jgi:hypothetical protein